MTPTLARSPITDAARQAIAECRDRGLAFAADLLFLEAWEADPGHGMGAALRARQIRRANPSLAAAIRDELAALAKRHT